MFYVSIFQLFWTFVSYNYTFGAKKSYHKIIMRDPSWQVEVPLMRGGYLCKVEVVEFPAGINTNCYL